MSINILVILVTLSALNVIQLLVLIVWQNRLKKTRQELEFEQRISRGQEEELAEAKLLYSQALQSQNKIPESVENLEEIEQEKRDLKNLATDSAEEIIRQAKLNADNIVEEAHQRARSYFKKQERELNRSLAKLVVQVAKKVTGRDLDYNQHKEIIMQMLDEL